MKILKIRLKNLNSLVGEWSIDLTESVFTSDGLFAITGRTGAGKTTIFDAVCLALYGKTPRLSRVSPTENEIMSRGTAECMAEVTFSANSQIYRCLWSQRRAYGKVEGALQPITRQLSVLNLNATNAIGENEGEILGESVSEVAEKIEELTHMNFEQFTRAVLLAQGRFDSFLKASLDDRRKILESITGTELYSNISQYVYQRFKQEDKDFQDIKDKQSNLSILTPEQETELRGSLETKRREVQVLNEQHEKTRAIQAWLSDVKKLEGELADIRQERAEFETDMANFEPYRVRLADGERAAKLTGDYAGLVAIRNALAGDREQLRECESGIPMLKARTEESAKAHESAEKALESARKALDDAAPELQRARSLDQSILDCTRELNAAKKALAQAQEQLNGKQRELDGVIREHSKVTKAREGLERDIETRKADAGLESALSGIEQLVRKFKERSEKVEATRERYREAQTKVDKAKKALKGVTAKHLNAENDFKLMQSELESKQAKIASRLNGRLLREYRAERSAKQTQLVLEQKLQGYEQERARLIAGEPCPLCGSVHHPYADDGLPLPDPSQTELAIKSLNDLIDAVESLQDDEKELITSVNEAKLLVEQYKGKVDSATLQLTHKQDTLNELGRKGPLEGNARNETLDDLLRVLSPFWDFRLSDYKESKDEPKVRVFFDRLLQELRLRAQSFKTLDMKYQDYKTQENELVLQIEPLKSAIATIRPDMESKFARVTDIDTQLNAIQLERANVIGGQDADVLQKKLKNTVDQAELAESKVRDASEKARGELVKAQSALKTIQDKIDSQRQILDTKEPEFRTKLAELSFTDESAFVKASIKSSELEKLRALANELARRKSNLDGRQGDREKALVEKRSEHPEFDLTKEPDAVKRFEACLDTDFKTEEENLTRLGKEQAQLEVKLQDSESDREKFLDFQKELDRRKPDHERWKALSDLIGSADGKKYSSFAQQVTLDLLVNHANIHLKKMSDRYRLTPVGTGKNDKDPLALEVLDNEHGGVQRPTSNLSGGESFMISLALALGLSQMNGQTTTIESLFLDEGFGSLDEEALDMALAALGSMHQEGRMIGIISHVEALKERIPTRIEVRPISGGRSEIILPTQSRYS